MCIRDRVGITADNAVGQVHNTGGVFLSQLRVVRNHDDQTVVRNLGKQIHNLDARFRIQRAGGLVGQQDLRVVDERTRNGHALHLTARQLARLLVYVVAQAHALERTHRAVVAFGTRNARQRQRQLYVRQHRLVRNEVVALEHETNAVVAVGVPVLVLVLLGGDCLLYTSRCV